MARTSASVCGPTQTLGFVGATAEEEVEGVAGRMVRVWVLVGSVLLTAVALVRLIEETAVTSLVMDGP